MMEKEELRSAMQSRPLRLSEVLQQSFQLMTERFGSFLLLMTMVYLPIHLILEYKMLQVDLTVEDTELLLSQLMSLYMVQMVLSFLEIVAILVTSVLAHNLIYGKSEMPFGSAFYRGIRMWVRAFLTMMVLVMGAVLCIMSMSMLMMFPGMMFLIFPVLLLLAVFYSLMQNFVCTSAALRGRMGMDNIRYTTFILKENMGRAIGYYAVILLITSGGFLLGDLLVSSMTQYIANVWIAMGIRVCFQVLLSILKIYAYIAGTLLFLNMEEGKRVLLEQSRKQ